MRATCFFRGPGPKFNELLDYSVDRSPEELALQIRRFEEEFVPPFVTRADTISGLFAFERDHEVLITPPVREELIRLSGELQCN